MKVKKLSLRRYRLISLWKYCSYCIVFWKRNGLRFQNGGYLVTDRNRLRFKDNAQEREKYAKEYFMCTILKFHGFRIEHLRDEKPDGTYDIHLNGVPADLKCLKGYSNIVRRATYAVCRQNAKLIVFQFEEWNDNYRRKIGELMRVNIHGYYFLSKNPLELHRF